MDKDAPDLQSITMQLSEVAQRLRDLSSYLAEGTVYAVREVFKGTYYWSGGAPRFAQFEGVAVDGLCDVLNTAIGPHPTLAQVGEALAKVQAELRNVKEHRQTSPGGGFAIIDVFTSDMNQRSTLSKELSELAGQISGLINEVRLHRRENLFKRLWHDPVWSKVISATILAFAAGIGTYLLDLWPWIANVFR